MAGDLYNSPEPLPFPDEIGNIGTERFLPSNYLFF